MVDGFFKTMSWKMDISTTLILVVFSLIGVQAFAFIFGKALGFEIFLGPIFMLIPLGISSLMAVAIVKRLITGEIITQRDMFAVFITAGLTVLVLIFLRDLVPEIFEQSMLALTAQLQSIVGL